ncbi:MAG: T9SS type A sorting domain-containing protein, partial [Bacteroidota bacterium]
LITNSIAGLTPGRHYLYFRTGSGSVWSHYHQMGFFVEDTQEVLPLSGAEFFFNEDPGLGEATAVELEPADEIDLSFELTPESLDPGRQFLYFRLRNGNTWSQYHQMGIFVEDTEEVLPLSGAEFFINEDPGLGEATAVELEPANEIDLSFDLTPESLDPGRQFLYFRLKNGNTWSQYARFPFAAIQSSAAFGSLTSFQFFFTQSDTEPHSWDNELPIEPADSIDGTFEFPSAGLTLGENRLFLKLADSRSIMSHYVFMDFYYCGTINPVIEADGQVLTCLTDLSPNSYQWLLNGDTIPGATESVFTAEQSGLYSVIVNYDEDCNELSDEVNIVIQSVENARKSSQLVIFPNPTKSYVHIHASEIVISMQISDLRGQQVFSAEPYSTEVQISTESFDAGIYIIHIETSGGNMVRKLVVQ